MYKILVPIDFSDTSLHAAMTAADIAKIYNAEIELIHIFESIVYPSTGEKVATDPITGLILEASIPIEDVLDHYEEYLEKIEKEITKKGVKCSSSVIDKNIFTRVAKLITEEAKSTQANLIVMGTQGVHNSVEEAILGSNASKVIRWANCPVLCIREETNLQDLADIVYVSNFKEPELDKNIENVVRMATLFDSTLTLLTINTPIHFEYSGVQNERFDQVISKYPNTKFKKVVYNESSIVNGIHEFENNFDVDLIVISTHGYTGLKRLRSENITEDVVSYCTSPVLTYK